MILPECIPGIKKTLYHAGLKSDRLRKKMFPPFTNIREMRNRLFFSPGTIWTLPVGIRPYGGGNLFDRDTPALKLGTAWSKLE
jgi:hypothetical protein